MRLIFPFILAVSLPATGQWLSVGVTGGVPISPRSAVYDDATVAIHPAAGGTTIIQAPNDFYQKPYAVGPAVEVRLPWKLSFETGMLYERFHRDISEGITPIKGGGANFGFVTSVAADAYAFPLLVKRDIRQGRLAPFVEAGTTLRHLGVFSGQGIQLDVHLQESVASFRFDPGKALDVALTAGAGVRWRVGRIDVIPEIRYLHWTAQYEQPVQDQAMLLVTIAFPARRARP